jgi:hypothetical protein
MNKISRKDLSRFLRRSAELVESVATKRLKTNVEFISVWQRRFEGVRKIYGLSATGTSTVGERMTIFRSRCELTPLR